MADPTDGPIYVSEYGKLVCPPGYEVVKSYAGKVEEDRENSLELSVPSIFRNNAVPSLLLICTQFVAQHLDHVDSLLDFPSLIGKSIFTRAKILKQFASPNVASYRRLSLFLEAYGCECLSQLSITGSPTFITQTLTEFPSLYSSVTHLELRSCQIGYHDNLIMGLNQLHQ